MKLHLLQRNVAAAALTVLSMTTAFGQTPPPVGGPPPGDPLGPDLFIAIRKGATGDLKAAIAHGAKVEGTNWLGLTPLMWAAAVGNREACAALLDAGANVNAPSHYGTALTWGEMGGNAAVVRLLIDRGAKLTQDRADGITPLMTAAENGRLEVVRLLLERLKADINAKDTEGTTALMYAARRGQTDAARVLLEAGANGNATDSYGRTAMMYAAMNGYPGCTTLLLGRPLPVNARDSKGDTALTLAARYAGDADVIRALVKAGADKSLKDAKGRTAFDLATQHQNRAIAAILRPGATLTASRGPATLATRAGDAATVSLALIESSTKKFSEQAACISCHHQGIGMMTTGLAKERGFTYDKALAMAQVGMTLKDNEAHGKEIVGVVPHPEMYKHVPGVDMDELTPMLAYTYMGLLAQGQPAGEVQQAATAILANQQDASGQWGFKVHREPMQSSTFMTTAMAVRLMNAYLPKDRAAEATERVGKARAWLIATPAVTNEDRVFRLLGLKWSGADANEIKKATAALEKAQRPDGGWAQFDPTASKKAGDSAYTRSDAYATGQALYALNIGGGLPVAADLYQRGVQYLLRTQDDDGSWLVTKRAVPANTYMDGGFPHGQSQYASYNATCWATMALILAARPTTTPHVATLR